MIALNPLFCLTLPEDLNLSHVSHRALCCTPKDALLRFLSGRVIYSAPLHPKQSHKMDTLCLITA